jgi:methylase of polypeptide subunit release factors
VPWPQHAAPGIGFVDHLIEACSRPIAEQPFEQGYAAVLADVARHSTFELHGFVVDAPAGVYSPHATSSTRFVMDHFAALGLAQPGGRFLEVGCGAGAISLLAARNGWNVFASDIDPAAVRATRANAERNGIHLSVRESDLFSAFKDETFDVILFNQPFFHVNRPVDARETTLTACGGRLHERFMRSARHYLRQGGRVVVTYANCSHLEALNQPGWLMELRAFDFDAHSNYIRAAFLATDMCPIAARTSQW